MMALPSFENETFKTFLEGYQVNRGDSLHKMRAKAWDHFLELGLPTRHNEVYRYIKLRHLLSQNYQITSESELDSQTISDFIYPECRESVIVFVNGYFSPKLSNTKALPSKVSILPLTQAMSVFGTFLNNFWAKSIKEETDPFASLNNAIHDQGLFLYIPPKTVVSNPIQILYIQKSEENLMMSLPHANIFIGSQSQVNIITTQKNLTSGQYFVNQLSELVIEEGATVNYTQILCDESPTGWHLDAFRAYLKRDAILKTVAVTEGGMTVRNDYRIILTGENAEALLNGVWMLENKKEAHVNVFMEHQAPYCRSYQLFKGVLNDFSRSSFEGKIMVRQAAQKTEAFQLNNNLLLSDHAHADSKPNLEIFADDVKASHGATVGQLDEEHLFYMKTRGFTDHEAKNLLVYGFCEQVIEMIPVSSIKEEISLRAQKYLVKT